MKKDTIIGQLHPEIMEEVTSRRDALRNLVRAGAGAALASAPLAFGAMARRAFAQSVPQEVIGVLKFALTLERLEASYYIQGVDSGVIPADIQQVFVIIRDHEIEHRDFLESTLQDLGASLDDVPSNFDFTAGGTFAPFTDAPTFLLLSQAFEDTGVRAYKGQADKLIDNDDILTAALKIHSVEARHAAKVRRLRELQGWIPFTQPGAPAAIEPVYQGMGQTVKYTIDVPAVSPVAPEPVTEAWDEPLSRQEVLSIVQPFLP